MFFMKIVSFMPLELKFIPDRYRVLRDVINLLHIIFWHFVVLHLLFLQMKTFFMNFNESLDETINYLMIGSIYGFGYFILCYMQLNANKFLTIIQFVNDNFRIRSAKGEKVYDFEILSSTLHTFRLYFHCDERECEASEEIHHSMGLSMSCRHLWLDCFPFFHTFQLEPTAYFMVSVWCQITLRLHDSICISIFRSDFRWHW